MSRRKVVGFDNCENRKLKNPKREKFIDVPLCGTDRWINGVDIYLYDRIWLFKRFGQLIWMNGWMNDAKWICLTSHGNTFRHIHHNWKIIEQCVRENRTREEKKLLSKFVAPEIKQNITLPMKIVFNNFDRSPYTILLRHSHYSHCFPSHDRDERLQSDYLLSVFFLFEIFSSPNLLLYCFHP